MTPHAPSQLRLSREGDRLDVDFGTLGHFALSAEFLRVHSPSAEVQGHGPGQRQLVGGKRAVRVVAIEPVGRYAVRLRFDDRHDTGIYSWEVLLALGEQQDRLWRDYLAALSAKGFSRDA